MEQRLRPRLPRAQKGGARDAAHLARSGRRRGVGSARIGLLWRRGTAAGGNGASVGLGFRERVCVCVREREREREGAFSLWRLEKGKEI